MSFVDDDIVTTQVLLAQPLKALGEEEFGSHRWVEHQTLTLKRLDALCAIFDDLSVPIDVVIKPCGIAPAPRLEQVVGHRRVLRESSEVGQGTVELDVPRIEIGGVNDSFKKPNPHLYLADCLNP